MSNEVINNYLFDRVFSNDLPGLKKLLDGFHSYYDKKKKMNLRDPFKRTILFYALFHQGIDMIDCLISGGCDTLYIDCKGRTALHYAVILGCEKKIIQLIIDYNKEIDQYRAHTREVTDELKARPIKNYDCTPNI